MQKNMELLYSVRQYTQSVMNKWLQNFPYSVSISALLVLEELKKNGPQKQITLTKLLKLTPGAMTNIAAKLVSEEYAERVYNVQDRRITRLKITDTGMGLLKIAYETNEELNADLLNTLSDEEKDLFIKLLKKVSQ
ncbi:MAG: MarR family transcriptional regulator [Pisciglobus halotolerans]|nr:MarR family transcriptional regulator [Pisciglobus halotolerans]